MLCRGTEFENVVMLCYALWWVQVARSNRYILFSKWKHGGSINIYKSIQWFFSSFATKKCN